jgi:hypothetical protein
MPQKSISKKLVKGERERAFTGIYSHQYHLDKMETQDIVVDMIIPKSDFYSKTFKFI